MEIPQDHNNLEALLQPPFREYDPSAYGLDPVGQEYDKNVIDESKGDEILLLHILSRDKLTAQVVNGLPIPDDFSAQFNHFSEAIDKRRNYLLRRNLPPVD